ncbi:BQ5605_C017g08520 [Microbotryum silenes-dioicae]|uniref:BQ5605_C017g08520 protein n=1 Tax=Microbotryum silenes-dioicae TaxID=796604 RepID=A0A2X0LV57_9BASI|nr:BQ5605_C017g08520 [Microbotryum silenes-dioicae]
MTVFTAPYVLIPSSSTPYPPSQPRGLSTHVSSPSTSRGLLRRLNSLLVKEHLHHPEPRTTLAPVFSLAELTPNHLLGLLEVILATRFDLSAERERDDRGDESWQFVLDDDDDIDDGAGMDDRLDEHKLHDERILRFLILGLQQALETRSLPEPDIETMLDILLADIDSSHRFGGSNSTRSGVRLIQHREHIIAWIVAGLFEIEDRLLDPLDTQLGHYYTTVVDRGEDSSHMVAELGIATTGSSSRGTTSATPTTPRKLLFRDSHTQPPRTMMTSPLKQALTTYLPPSPSPRLETTPRKSIVGLLRRDKQARSTSPSPKSKRHSLETSSLSLMLVRPEMERYDRSRPSASIIGVKMARKRDVSDSVGESDLDLSERTCDCETEGYRETGEGDQTEVECSCCAHMDDGTETQDEPVDAVPIHRLSDRPLDASAQRPNWHLTIPKESNAKLFPPARFVTTPLNRNSPTSSSSSSNEDEYVVNLRRKREREEVEKMKLRSCGLDTDLECARGPSWVTGWSEKELQGVKGRR